MEQSNESGYRPCVVVAQVNPTEAGRRLRRLGWDVYEARSGPEARRLARMLEAELVVLGVELAQESGWLTCAKFTDERSATKVILLGDPTARNQELARFVGACTLVPCPKTLATWMTLGWERARAA